MGIAIMIGNRVGRSGSGSYWTPARIATTFLFYGDTSKITGGKLYNQVTGRTAEYLTVAGSAGSETYQAPDNATYQTADTDYIWFKTDATQRTTTTAELIGYDLQRTPVKYDDNSPNTIRKIGILKSGVVLTANELNHLFDLFDLPIEWHNDTNAYGHIKDNRTGQNLWVPESVYDAASDNLFARLLVKGETPTSARKTAINTAIVALKAANLFDTQFDVFVATRGFGPYTRKENWIKDSRHALAVANGGVLTETDDVGINSDGIKSYLRTQYTPSSDGSLYKKDDCCFGIKISGTIAAGATGHGGVITGYDGTMFYDNAGNAYDRCNCTNVGNGNSARVVGYNCLSRIQNTEFLKLTNALSQSVPEISTSICGKELKLLAVDNDGTMAFFCADTEVIELYFAGKYLSQANFLIFQGIMNTYFASL